MRLWWDGDDGDGDGDGDDSCHVSFSLRPRFFLLFLPFFLFSLLFPAPSLSVRR